MSNLRYGTAFQHGCAGQSVITAQGTVCFDAYASRARQVPDCSLRSHLPSRGLLYVLACLYRAMGDFLMRESQPVAFRASWTLDASYESHAEEDGEGDWGAAPQRPADMLLYEEVYVERKLHPPSDPVSVVVKRPHSFAEGVASQLLPPHPIDAQTLPILKGLSPGKHLRTIGMHLYAPITCPEAPTWPPQSGSFVPCQDSYRTLLSTVKQTEKIEGVSSFEVQVEVLQLAEGEGRAFSGEARVCGWAFEAEKTVQGAVTTDTWC